MIVVTMALLRSVASFPWSTGYIDKCSVSPCTTTSTWSLNVRTHCFRVHRRGIPLSLQSNLKRATWTFQKQWALVPVASLAQSSRPSFASEEKSLGSLLTLDYAAPILRREDEDTDGGRAYNSNGNLDSREQLRRERIGKSNRGKVPWNKGRRHSPETIAKIKERTRLAMLKPEIRDKLRIAGKNQSPETKAKIHQKMVGYWEVKRAIKAAQEICFTEWKEAIAEAARVGTPGDEELQWDSYKKIKAAYKLEKQRAERLEREALRARLKPERKKKTVSDAHRKAISDAIRAKWTEPEYQAKVSAAMAVRKQRRIPVDIHKKTVQLRTPTVATVEEASVEKKKPVPAVPVDENFIAEVLAEAVTLNTKRERSTAARKRGPRKVTLVSLEDHDLLPREDSEPTVTNGQSAEREAPVAAESDVRIPTASSVDVELSSKLSSQSYKDPFVLEKLQRIQQLRKGRLEVEQKRKEAADRARMLIANAERAAAALEQSGNADAATLATLREARRVLAEATRSVQAAELKPGSPLTPPTSTKNNEDGTTLSGSRSDDFHSRIWTEGGNIEDCPHSIPIRMSMGKVPFRGEHELDGVSWSNGSRMSGWAASQSDAAKEQVLEGDVVGHATGSEGQNEEAVHREEYRNRAADETDRPRLLPKNKSGGSKKRWHRGRLVAIDEDERT